MIRKFVSRYFFRVYYGLIIIFCVLFLVGKLISLYYIPEWSPAISLLSAGLAIVATGKILLKGFNLKVAERRYSRKLIVLPPLHFEIRRRHPLTFQRIFVNAASFALVMTSLIGGVWYVGSHVLSAMAAQQYCIAQPSPMPLVSNDIPDPGLEAQNSPTPWQQMDTGKGNTAQFSSTVQGFQSKHALEITVSKYTSGFIGWAYPPKPGVAGETYQYADWYQATVPTRLLLEYTENGITSYKTLDGDISPSAGWRHYSLSFDLPGSVVADSIPISIMHVLAQEGQLSTDDMIFHLQTDAFVRPLISITFDDGFRGQYENALPLLCKYHIPATFYIVSDYILKGYADYMLPNMVSGLVQHGMEIGDHTVDHRDLNSLFPSQVSREIEQSKTDIEHHFGVHVLDFAPPYGDANDRVMQQVRPLYQSSRSTDVGLNTASSFDTYNIMCVTIDTQEGTSLGNIENWIDQAISAKAWLVLAFHQVDGPGQKFYDNSDPYNASPDFLEKILSYVATQRIQPVTINQGLSEVYQQI